MASPLVPTHGGPPLEDEAALWQRAIDRAIAGEVVPTIVHQPILDLARGTIAGYEALARFPGPPSAGPDDWFARAASQGRLAAFEAVILAKSLLGLAALPVDTFLTVNVTPALLGAPALDDILAPFGRLDRLVVEVTEHMAIDDYDVIRDAIARLRNAGALFAVDDAGAGYASMRHVLALRPDFVKLDRQFVAGCDSDPARVALIEALGGLASRLDSCLVAEGVERREELECLMRLRVPLAQGWFLGHEQPEFGPAEPESRQVILAQRSRVEDGDSVLSLIEEGPVARHGTRHQPASLPWLVLDATDRPSHWHGVPDVEARPLVVKPSTPVKHVARRAMTRPAAARFMPVVCTDEQGRYLGIVRVERLIERLASA